MKIFETTTQLHLSGQMESYISPRFSLNITGISLTSNHHHLGVKIGRVWGRDLIWPDLHVGSPVTLSYPFIFGHL